VKGPAVQPDENGGNDGEVPEDLSLLHEKGKGAGGTLSGGTGAALPTVFITPA
jgi:hypothetical protein